MQSRAGVREIELKQRCDVPQTKRCHDGQVWGWRRQPESEWGAIGTSRGVAEGLKGASLEEVVGEYVMLRSNAMHAERGSRAQGAESREQ